MISLYHGTTGSREATIIAEGLRRPVFLAAWPGLAEYYAAEVAASVGERSGIVYEVLVDPASLKADMASYVEPVMIEALDRDDVVRLLESIGQLTPAAAADAQALEDNPDYLRYLNHANLKPDEWQRSLVLTGAVVSVGPGPVPPASIQALYEVESGLESDEYVQVDDEEGPDVGGRRSLGQTLRARLQRPDLLHLLHEARIEAWDEGGCWPLAYALKRWLGRYGRMRGVYTANGIMQHAVVQVRTARGDRYLDGEGSFTAKGLIRHWTDNLAAVFRAHPAFYPPRLGPWNPQAALRTGFCWIETAPIEAALRSAFGKPEDWGLLELPQPGTPGRRGKPQGGSVGGRRKPTRQRPYSHPESNRGRRLDPADPQCAPPNEELQRWQVAASAGNTPETIQALLKSMPPSLVWQAFVTMLQMARERLGLTPPTDAALQWVIRWASSQSGLEGQQPHEGPGLSAVRTALAASNESDVQVWGAIDRVLRSEARRQTWVQSPDELVAGVARAVYSLAFALAYQAVALDSPYRQPPLIDEAWSWFLACWADRIKKRFAFVMPDRSAPGQVSGDELMLMEGDVVAGPRARSDWWKRYVTQLDETRTSIGPVAHLRIKRHDGKPIRAGWDTLQKIKNDRLGEDVTAIEVFPAEQDVVNEANIRHLWVLPEDTLPNLLPKRYMTTGAVPFPERPAAVAWITPSGRTIAAGWLVSYEGHHHGTATSYLLDYPATAAEIIGPRHPDALADPVRSLLRADYIRVGYDRRTLLLEGTRTALDNEQAARQLAELLARHDSVWVDLFDAVAGTVAASALFDADIFGKYLGRTDAAFALRRKTRT